jgi:hydroxymethylbilane synthase
MKIILGTRGSTLALAQAHWVKNQLQQFFPSLEIELKIIKTIGDKILDSPLSKIGDKGVFVKELETALEKKEVDVAVHSVKDLPTLIPKNLTLAAIPPREEPWDMLVTQENLPWEALPKHALIGTSALRRQSQILFHRPDLKISLLRGNVDTRLRKLDSGDFFGIVLAQAGLNRLGIRRGRVIPRYIMLPAPGQGALALEARKSDEKIIEIVKKLHDEKTGICVSAERRFLSTLEGGCQVPVGAYAELQGEQLVLEGFVGSPEGNPLFREKIEGDPKEAEALGERLAVCLLKKGGKKIIENLYHQQ